MNAGLTGRLRRHVRGELADPDLAWWTPTSVRRPLAGVRRGPAVAWWRLTAGRHGTGALAGALERVAERLDAGCGLAGALAGAADVGHWPAVDDLRVVVGWIDDGLAAPAALRRWAVLGGDPAVAWVAGVAAAGATDDDLARRLRAVANELQADLRHRRVVGAQRAARLAWLAALLSVVAALHQVVPSTPL